MTVLRVAAGDTQLYGCNVRYLHVRRAELGPFTVGRWPAEAAAVAVGGRR